MAAWVKAPGGRRPQPMPNGGNVKPPYRPFRRAPYPLREDRNELQDESQSFEALDQQHEYSAGTADYERYQHSQKAASNVFAPVDKRNALYQRFYAQVQEDYEKRCADCVVLSVSTQNMDYAKSIGHCLQERGLAMEMIYLQAESGLTRALQDVRAHGSPLCILVEQTNVALSSCTVIIFSESLKIHRNMPQDHAMDFVMAEFGRVHAEREEKEPGEMAAKAAQMADDYLEREKLERHSVPLATRHLLHLLAEGLHLYPEDLGKLTEYVRSRQDQLQDAAPEGEEGSYPVRMKILPSGLGKPPPLLPTPSGPHGMEHPSHPPNPSEHPCAPLLPTPGSYPKTKPPPTAVHAGSPGPPPWTPTVSRWVTSQACCHAQGAPHVPACQGTETSQFIKPFPQCSERHPSSQQSPQPYSSPLSALTLASCAPEPRLGSNAGDLCTKLGGNSRPHPLHSPAIRPHPLHRSDTRPRPLNGYVTPGSAHSTAL
ncbi:hypothetical protein SKAU_G00315950 [Synaphobranchus kaupii]|uniref:Nuclear receptor coactivator 5 n=1 Tax=Synaphobranchus kaupii TaxID=118154 RepID=A0A9Q1ESM3_SYNKA|nr:hypothetical protein SKAU_G00315950 [Synaphobranchus kaupii]